MKAHEEKSYTFIIPGDPTPLARCRFGKGRFYDAQKNLKLVWGITLNNQLNEIKDLHLPLSGPLSLAVTFFFKIPRSRQKELKEGYYHFQRPDTDNLIKFVNDATQTILFTDDCTIAHVNAEKRFSNEPRTEFTILRLGKQ